MGKIKHIDFLSKITPSGITETEDAIQFDVVALSATSVDRRYKEEDKKTGFYKLTFPPEELQKAAPSLNEKPLYTDHLENIDNTRGVVLSSEWDSTNKWIKARLQLAKAGNERLISLIKMDPSPINNFSASIFYNKDKVNDSEYLAKDIVFQGLSIVTKGADSNASRLSDEEEYPNKEENPSMAGELERLQQDLSTTTEKLSAAESRISVLETEKKELSTMAAIGKQYKEKLSADVKKCVILVEGDKSPILEMLESAGIETLEKLKADYYPKAQKKTQPSSREALGGDGGPDTPEELSDEKLDSMSYEQLMGVKEILRKEPVK
jgi:hypothetical protein